MKVKSRGTIALIGKNGPGVVVCEVVNGKPKVKRVVREDCIEFHLRYSLFHKEIKRYDKNTFEELKGV